MQGVHGEKTRMKVLRDGIIFDKPCLKVSDQICEEIIVASLLQHSF